MRNPVRDVREELDCIDRLLRGSALFSMTGPERQSLREQANLLRSRLARIEGRFLTVGFLGGTGVGKSSMLNALAGAEIASSSLRRPHTDHVLVYRHAEAPPLPLAEFHRVPYREVTHDAAPMKALLLCDLPDFDSLAGEHREYVVTFLEHLDLLVWVASPEKYADGRFYAFLGQVPKAREHFTFVLNKVDLLLEGEPGIPAHDRISSVMRGFREHLLRQDIADPLIFAVSAEKARQAFEPDAWNQFDFFRRHLLEQQHIKTITAIKAANLGAEVRRLLTPLEKERLNLEEARRLLMETDARVREKYAEWERTGRDAIEAWLAREPAAQWDPVPDSLSGLAGPGYALGMLLQALKAGRVPTGDSGRHPFFLPPRETEAVLKRPFHWAEEHLHRGFLHANLPEALWDGLKARLDLEGEFQGLGGDIAASCERYSAEATRPAFWGFRAAQYVLYGLLTLCLLAALVGAEALRAFSREPGAGTVLGILAAAVETLFSPRGLASLLSYALINLFLSIRFYRRYNDRLEAHARRRRARLSAALATLLTEHLEGMGKRLLRVEKETEERIETLSTLSPLQP